MVVTAEVNAVVIRIRTVAILVIQEILEGGKAQKALDLNRFTPNRIEVGLFREALTGLVNELLVDLVARSGSVRQDLLRFAESFQTKTMSEQGLALHRMLVAESPRFPELARAVCEAWQVAAVELARLLHEAMARGELREGDVDFAADMLLSMLTGTQRDLHLFGMAPTAPQQVARTVQIIECFLQAYAPQRSPMRIEGNPE